jgi:hypothetical protein
MSTIRIDEAGQAAEFHEVPMRAASKTFRTEVRHGNENYNDVPSVVEFSIDEATAAQIILLAAIVKSNDLYKVEKFDYRARYLNHDPDQDPEDATLAGEENEFRTEADVLNVSEEEFWFSAYIKHTDIEILSEQQRIDGLVQHFAFDLLQDAHDRAIGAPRGFPNMVASADDRGNGQDGVPEPPCRGIRRSRVRSALLHLERNPAMTHRYHHSRGPPAIREEWRAMVRASGDRDRRCGNLRGR